MTAWNHGAPGLPSDSGPTLEPSSIALRRGLAVSQRFSAAVQCVAVPLAAAAAAVSVQALTARRAALRVRMSRDLAETKLALAERDALFAKLQPIKEVWAAGVEFGGRVEWEKCRALMLRTGVVPGRREPRIMHHEGEGGEATG